MTKHTKRPSHSQQLGKLKNLEEAFYQKDQENRQLRNQLVQMQNNISGYNIRLEALKLACTNQMFGRAEQVAADIRERAIIYEKWLIEGFAESQTKDKEE